MKKIQIFIKKLVADPMRAFLFLSFCFWFLIGLFSITISLIVGILMLINAGVFYWLYLKIHDANKKVYLFSVFWIVLNMLLSLADQIGVLDMSFFLFNFVMLVVFIKNKPDNFDRKANLS